MTAAARGQRLPLVPLCQELGASCHHLLGSELAHTVVLHLASLNHQRLVLEGRGERGEGRGERGEGRGERGEGRGERGERGEGRGEEGDGIYGTWTMFILRNGRLYVTSRPIFFLRMWFVLFMNNQRITSP